MYTTVIKNKLTTRPKQDWEQTTGAVECYYIQCEREISCMLAIFSPLTRSLF